MGDACKSFFGIVYIVPFLIFFLLIQAASTLRLTSTTRYLTRVYLDLLLHNCSHIHEAHYIALTVAALSLAIKVPLPTHSLTSCGRWPSS